MISNRQIGRAKARPANAALGGPAAAYWPAVYKSIDDWLDGQRATAQPGDGKQAKPEAMVLNYLSNNFDETPSESHGPDRTFKERIEEYKRKPLACIKRPVNTNRPFCRPSRPLVTEKPR